jgi:hypothetical protein
MPAQIARTIIGRAIISTVSLDFASKDIHQYETMIYTDNNKFLDYCDKHKTLDEARQGHIYAIQYLLTERESTNDNSNTIPE